MSYLVWITGCHMAIQLSLLGYSLYWVVLVSRPIFRAACGSGCLAIGVMIILFSVFSLVLTVLGFKSLADTQSINALFDAWFLVTAITIAFVAVAIVATCPESQKVCQSQIVAYAASYSDGKTAAYLSKYGSEYDQLVFEFNYGQTSCNAFLTIEVLWIVFLVWFCAVRELRAGATPGASPSK